MNDRFLQGWSYEDIPKYKIFCNECKYMFTVISHTKEGLKYADIYESCQEGPRGGISYIVNFSDNPGDYISGIDMKSLFSHLISDMKGYRLKGVAITPCTA
jgi:hypothetical protein